MFYTAFLFITVHTLSPFFSGARKFSTTSPHLTSSHLTSPHLTLPYCIFPPVLKVDKVDQLLPLLVGGFPRLPVSLSNFSFHILSLTCLTCVFFPVRHTVHSLNKGVLLTRLRRTPPPSTFLPPAASCITAFC